ncbi:MAG TPA: hypothetical protein [Caudoviricetes sp.]|jgi:hypothetical protein|nr:MAG TPA: hypothetical protein [Caudoviricetes sp.]
MGKDCRPFAVGAIATWIFQWTAVEWLVCDLRNEG